MSSRADTTKCGKPNPDTCNLHGRNSQSYTARAKNEYIASNEAYNLEIHKGAPSYETYEKVSRDRIAYFTTNEGQDMLHNHLAQARHDNNIETIRDLVNLQYETEIAREKYEALDSIPDNFYAYKSVSAQPLPLPVTKSTDDRYEKFSEIEHNGITTILSWNTETGDVIVDDQGDIDDMRYQSIKKTFDRSEAYAAATQYYNQNILPFI
jgi:hypothetical protein